MYRIILYAHDIVQHITVFLINIMLLEVFVCINIIYPMTSPFNNLITKKITNKAACLIDSGVLIDLLHFVHV